MKIVEVKMLPGFRREVEVDDGATVRDAVAVAGLSLDQHSISVSDNPSATADSVVSNGATILLTRQTKGA